MLFNILRAAQGAPYDGRLIWHVIKRTTTPVTGKPFTVKINLSAFKDYGPSLYKSQCYLTPGAFINAGKCRAGNVHRLGTFFLIQELKIAQADGLIFF